MPIFWQNKETALEQNPEQFFAIGNQDDDVFALMHSRTEAFCNTVRIRSEWMWGKSTTHSYDILMCLAQLKNVVPQISTLQRSELGEPMKWMGIRHQYGCGKRLNHLLVPVVQQESSVITLGISNAKNTHLHTIDFIREQVRWDVFELLVNLHEAIHADNTSHGYWYDRLRSED